MIPFLLHCRAGQGHGQYRNQSVCGPGPGRGQARRVGQGIGVPRLPHPASWPVESRLGLGEHLLSTWPKYRSQSTSRPPATLWSRAKGAEEGEPSQRAGQQGESSPKCYAMVPQGQPAGSFPGGTAPRNLVCSKESIAEAQTSLPRLPDYSVYASFGELEALRGRGGER